MTEQYHPTVSVIIPTLNAGKDLGELLQKLHTQNYPLSEIIVVDSASDDNTVEICRNDQAVTLIQIERADFDHGKTRDMALRKSKGDVVVFMTQDAVPADDDLIGNLIAPLADPTVAISTARQLPKPDATEMERLVRTFNYPAQSHIRSKADIERMGIKTFYSSDVCAAYNREIYFNLGGFDYPLKTNEDMFIAAKAIHAGYKIAYIADACVFHSHNLSLRAQYRRNYIQSFEMEKHKKLLGNISKEKEGGRLVKFVSGKLLRKGRVISFARFGFDCCARMFGNKAGKAEYNRNNRSTKILTNANNNLTD